MTLALTSRGLGARTPEALRQALHAVGVPRVVLLDPPPDARGWRAALADAGVEVVAVAQDPHAAGELDATRLATRVDGLVQDAAALRAGQVVCAAGRLAGRDGAAAAMLGRELLAARGRPAAAVDPSLERLRAARDRVRAGQVEGLARALHGALAAGVPLAIAHGGAAEDLLHLEETVWLLDALPRLGVWIDPARALALSRLGLAPEPLAWAERLARRTAGVFVHGLGSDGRGHAHPEDDGPPWGRLGEALPQRVPWALDLSGRLDTRDVTDALRSLERALSTPGA